MRSEIEEFKKTLGLERAELGLLETVFVHKSYLNEKGGAEYRESNERLEFLGDAVLSCVISALLYQRFPAVEEGELTRMRARLVNKRALAEVASELGMGGCLLMGRGEYNAGGALNPTILAGALEALLGAIYMGAGFDEAAAYIGRLFTPMINETLAGPGHFDFKPRLQEIAQRVYRDSPVYRLVNESGPPHKKIFEVEVSVQGNVLGLGAASSKKEAEQAAASEALKRLDEEGGQRP
ncbi:MAG: ribonuclease III [Deltaproteobacteria bacterium]|nr:ribonuclease III [Deltaproteobacteria bacterium]